MKSPFKNAMNKSEKVYKPSLLSNSSSKKYLLPQLSASNNKLVIAYTSSDNFLSPVPVSDWVIFCFWKFDISAKKEMKMIKTQFFN